MFRPFLPKGKERITRLLITFSGLYTRDRHHQLRYYSEEMSSEHSQPEEGATCACCWDNVTAENYVEYKASADDSWHPSGYCLDCINILLKSQWQQYNDQVKTVKCKAEQRRLLTRGPPINLRVCCCLKYLGALISFRTRRLCLVQTMERFILCGICQIAQSTQPNLRDR